MDWSFMERFAPLYVQAAGLTLRIGSLGIALSLGVGLLCCLARYYRVPGLNAADAAGRILSWRGTRPCWYSFSFCISGCRRSG